MHAESSLLQCPVSDLGPPRSPCQASVLPWSFTPNEKQVNNVRKSVRESARESERRRGEKKGEGERRERKSKERRVKVRLKTQRAHTGNKSRDTSGV